MRLSDLELQSCVCLDKEMIEQLREELTFYLPIYEKLETCLMSLSSALEWEAYLKIVTEHLIKHKKEVSIIGNKSYIVVTFSGTLHFLISAADRLHKVSKPNGLLDRLKEQWNNPHKQWEIRLITEDLSFLLACYVDFLKRVNVVARGEADEA